MLNYNSSTVVSRAEVLLGGHLEFKGKHSGKEDIVASPLLCNTVCSLLLALEKNKEPLTVAVACFHRL